MPLDPRSIGLTVNHPPVEWTADDVMLYALSVGAGGDELERTTENTKGRQLQPYPWMSVLFCQPPAALWSGVGDFDWAGLVHAEQHLEIHQPFPTKGEATAKTTLVDLYDKGSAAIVVTETTLDAAGTSLATGRGLTYIRGAGGWGGDRGPSHSPAVDRPSPDRLAEVPTDPRAALLYRINGDRNPLHSDPEFARAAGFNRPIMHGLCTFGIALRSLLRLTDPDGLRTIRSVSTRFARPMFPGDLLSTRGWVDGDDLHFTATSGGTAVLERGLVRFA